MDPHSDHCSSQNKNEKEQDTKKRKAIETHNTVSAPVPTRSSTKSKVRHKKTPNDYGDVIDSELATVAGQLASNPNLTHEEARVAAKREYNRLNAARARGRQKDRFRELKKEYAQMKVFVQQLQNENENLQSQVNALLQLRNSSSSFITAPPPPAPLNISVQKDASVSSDMEENGYDCHRSKDETVVKKTMSGNTEVCYDKPVSNQKGMTDSDDSRSPDMSLSVSSADLVNAAICTVMSMMTQQQHVTQQTILNQAVCAQHQQQILQKGHSPATQMSVSPHDGLGKFLCSQIHALSQTQSGQHSGNQNTEQLPLPTLPHSANQAQDQQRAQTLSISKSQNPVSPNQQTDMNTIMGFVLQNLTPYMQSGNGSTQSGGSMLAPSDK